MRVSVAESSLKRFFGNDLSNVPIQVAGCSVTVAEIERYGGRKSRFFRIYQYTLPPNNNFASNNRRLHLPYIARFTSFSLLFEPSTKPLFHA